MKTELGEYAVRAGPGALTATTGFMGLPWDTMVQIVVFLYTVIQMGFFIYAKWEKHQEKKAKANGG
jgi:hypothetical protein